MSFKRMSVTFVMMLAVVFAASTGLAQEAAAAAAAAPAAPAAAEQSFGSALWDILYGGSIVNLIIWLGLFATSVMMIIFVVNAFMTVKAERLMPSTVINGVSQALSEGDLEKALQTCDMYPSQLSTIVRAGFNNIEDGYEVVQQAVSQATDLEAEKLMQKVNQLNTCGLVAPMLGLMGTVVGMVMAFAGLASATGAAKTKVLAQSISTALWTTCVGLLISVPALLFFTYFKNTATRLLLESESKVLELIKVLRNVEVSE